MFCQFSRFVGSVFSAAALFAAFFYNQPALAQTSVSILDNEWDGIYVGSLVGGGATLGSTSTLAQRGNGFFQSTTKSETGSEFNEVPTAELFAAYDNQFNRKYVLGIRIEASVADIDFSSKGQSSARYAQPGIGGPPLGPVDLTMPIVADVRLHRTVTMLGRLGWLFDPKSMIYGIVGWTHGRFEIETIPVDSFPVTIGFGVVTPVDVSAPHIEKNVFGANGISVGGGVEKKLTSSWNFVTEYRYLRFVDITFDKTNYDPQPNLAPRRDLNLTDVQTGKFENEMHSLRVGFAYRLPLRN